MGKIPPSRLRETADVPCHPHSPYGLTSLPRQEKTHREREQEDALVHSGSSACPVRIDMAFPSLPLESLSSLSLSLPLKNRSDYP